ncbi:ABC transporter permease [Rhizocola hellebori]|uniref:ABC transporter permease n=1 Tax=Rhizocola hellebori TaxID=1392758 RepID=A0A8J3VKD6_9ACTN|nr:iron ABC transporter permease [Rhizocola hellebori]GIH10359.1 ABC transporter permease [Rhizocola hellebori]
MRRALLVPVLTALLVVAIVVNLGAGAVQIGPLQVVDILFGTGLGEPAAAGQSAVLLQIRAPRVALCALTGACLAVSGAALQGVFRNPLADPGIIGVTSGAAVGAAASIVIGLSTFGGATAGLAAFAGGLAAAAVGYFAARHQGRTEVVTLVLTGVAVSAIAGAAVGVFIYLADDNELRTLIFWTMGSLGTATWPGVKAVAPLLILSTVALPFFARGLNALVLGEREARHLGFHPERLRIGVIVLAALGTGAAVSLTGAIGFVGLVIPHLIRLIAGPDHRLLLPASAIGGAALLLAADLISRTAVAPAEMPVGVITALIGGPFFLLLLIRSRRLSGGWA